MTKVEILKQNGYNFLWIDGYLWMWDIPPERTAQKLIAQRAYGDVLVVGYGLGVLQRYLISNYPRVNLVRTCEKYTEVLSLCKKEFNRLYGRVYVCDFFKLYTDKKFDCVIGDIWGDIIPECLPDYKKFKAHAEKFLKPDGKILAWGQDYFEYLIKEQDEGV